MAKDKKAAKEPKSKKKLFIILAIVLLVLILGAGGYAGFAYFTKSGPFAPVIPTQEEIDKEAKAREAQMKLASEERVVYLESAFTFNLQETSKRQRLVQIEVALVVLGPENEELATKHKQLIASEISNVLSKQSYTSLMAQSGRERLKHLLLETIRARLIGIVSKPVVDQVLFTNFVMQ